MKRKVNGFVHWHKWSWQENGEFQISSCDMSNTGPDWVLIAEREFEVEIPDDFDPRQQQVTALRNEKTKILAEAQAKATNIEEQIQRLLCIEHKPAKDEAPA